MGNTMADDLEIGPDASDLAEPAPKGPFMPAPEDRSYIANEYRARVAEIAALKADRSAFAAETQQYRDAWLEDQDTIAKLKADNTKLREALRSLRGELRHHDGKTHEPVGCWGCQLRLHYIDPVLNEEEVV